MKAFTFIFDNLIIQALGWTLLHFLWQGALLAALFWLVRGLLRQKPANTRYLAAVGTLALMVLLPALTFISLAKLKPQNQPFPPIQWSSPVELRPVTESNAALEVASFEGPWLEAPWTNKLQSATEQCIPFLVLLWAGTVWILSLRLLGGWLKLQQLLRKPGVSAGATFEQALARLSTQLGITRPVKLIRSNSVDTPAVLGWLRPVILLPASALTGLTPAQWEAVLAHELAHIRRHDYLVNLFQSIAEMLLFYHPAVWWVSRQIEQEREHCCDDLSIQLCGDRLDYAHALLALEQFRSDMPLLKVAAGSGSLKTRIERLLGLQPVAPRSNFWLACSLATLLAMTSLLLATRATLFAGAHPLMATETQIDVPSASGEFENESAPQPAEADIVEETKASPGNFQPDGSNDKNQLYTRTFKLDPATLLRRIQDLLRSKGNAPHPESQSLAVMLREYIMSLGLDVSAWQSPEILEAAKAEVMQGNRRALFYNDRAGILFMRATLEELNIIEQGLHHLNKAPTQILLEYKIAEMPEAVFNRIGLDWFLEKKEAGESNDTGDAMREELLEFFTVKKGLPEESLDLATDSPSGVATGILSGQQRNLLMAALEKHGGVDILTAPRVTTLSGRQAQISVSQVRNLVTGVELDHDAVTNEPRATYKTVDLPVGISLDVIPYASEDLSSIALTIIPRITEFLGYAPSRPLLVAGSSMEAVEPLPRVRVRQAVAHLEVPKGHSAVIAGLIIDDEVLARDKIPVLGDLPMLGRFFRSETAQTVRKVRLIFITPIPIDPAGNRL
jgi:beta-lactamase regulating signal transducer with metallopeptidase domain/Flp pilus assembly secretin CpaC